MIAIDLGSNSLRIVEIDCSSMSFVKEYEKIVKTAELLYNENIISDTAISRITSALLEAKNIFDFQNSKYIGVTTEAMRRAENADEALKKIYLNTGIKINIIDAKKEAKLTLLAVTKRLDRLGFRGSFLLVDIGGGSTEIIFKKGNLSESKSFPIGIVTMACKYPSKKEIDQDFFSEFTRIKEYVDSYYKREGKPDFFVATAGTPTTIAAVKHDMGYDEYDKNIINGSPLNYFDSLAVLKKLLELSSKERVKYVGEGREELIVIGVMIYATFFKLFDFETSVVIDDGLREGVGICACEEKIDSCI